MPVSTPVHAIQTLLVANRGEIACRVIATARRLGLRTVAIYSSADANAMHVQAADVAVCVGDALPSSSYLNIESIIAAAIMTSADAIHPGYGFLSENPEFVEACDQANILFVGPDASAMRSMGLKDAAKALMEDAGVPVVPGYHGDNQEPVFLAEQAEAIGYPVLIKARAGGGGKGMRKVDQPDEFVGALTAAQREGAASFGDASVLIEKYIEQPRHIEVQVFGDKHDNYVHLYERDCSLQRRHQKVIEEAPAPGMSDDVRQAMTDAAIRTAQSISYTGAGTVEFIVDASGPLRTDGFWFMEMNTRLQVEHPVTEAVTGFDLVEWQLLVAAGHPLPVRQSDITLNGHSVEARLYAEDVAAGFLPATGTLHRFSMSEVGRVDTGVKQGDVVQPFYDPMLAKLISHTTNRGDAFAQLARMLDSSVVMGTITNRAFLADLCRHPDVIAGRVHTGLIETDMVPDADQAQDDPLFNQRLSANLALAAVMSVGVADTNTLAVQSSPAPNQTALAASREADEYVSAMYTPMFQRLGVWQLWGQPRRKIDILVNQEVVSLQIEYLAKSRWRVSLMSEVSGSDVDGSEANGSEVNDQSSLFVQVDRPTELADGTPIIVDGQRMHAIGFRQFDSIYCRVGQQDAQFRRPAVEHADGVAAMGTQLIAPMPGRIIAVNCASGDSVSKGDVLVTLEAMKMEHNLVAGDDVIIDQISVRVDDQVEQGKALVSFADKD